MSNQGEDGWYPECSECGCGNLGEVVCINCHNKSKECSKSEENNNNFTKETE